MEGKVRVTGFKVVDSHHLRVACPRKQHCYFAIEQIRHIDNGLSPSSEKLTRATSRGQQRNQERTQRYIRYERTSRVSSHRCAPKTDKSKCHAEDIIVFLFFRGTISRPQLTPKSNRPLRIDISIYPETNGGAP